MASFKQGSALVRLALGLGAVCCCSTAGAMIKGKWINPSKSVIIDIEPCGHHLCGTVVWASEKAKRDCLKGTKHLVGSRLLTDMKHSSEHVWKGMIFVPDQNMHASAKIRPEGATHLKVSGCVMMICKSQLWSKTHQSHA